jgi:hypothetical protein
MFDGQNFVHSSHKDLALSEMNFNGHLSSTPTKYLNNAIEHSRSCDAKLVKKYISDNAG